MVACVRGDSLLRATLEASLRRTYFGGTYGWDSGFFWGMMGDSLVGLESLELALLF